MKKSLFLVLALALLNSGCSTVSLVYHNADWYLQHKINSYTSFNAQQQESIRREVSGYMQWHRKIALPEYIIFLQNLNGAVQYNGRLSSGEADLLRTHLLNLYKKTLKPSIRPAAEILSTLDSRQIQELARNLAEENREHRQEELAANRDAYLERRADKTISFLEWLAGDLSTGQEHKVREMSRQLPVVNDIYFRLRVANQAGLISLLNGHADKEKIAAFLTSWILTPEAGRSPQQQQAIESFELASDEMIAEIHGMLTEKQKDHVHKMIASYIDDMRAENRKALRDSGP